MKTAAGYNRHYLLFGNTSSGTAWTTSLPSQQEIVLKVGIKFLTLATVLQVFLTAANLQTLLLSYQSSIKLHKYGFRASTKHLRCCKPGTHYDC